jgi:hypothetical protein
MKAYRLFNQTELEPAATLLFLRRQDAEAFRETVLWPYANEGRWPLKNGASLPLRLMEFRAESLNLAAEAVPELGLVLSERAGTPGACPLLPGDCFDPDQWQALPPGELEHPERGPLLQGALLKAREADFASGA